MLVDVALSPLNEPEPPGVVEELKSSDKKVQAEDCVQLGRAGATRCWQLLVPQFVKSVALNSRNSTAIVRNF